MADPKGEKKAKWIKTARWIYWPVTWLFVATMVSAGLTYLAGASFNVEGITHLRHPLTCSKSSGPPNSSVASRSCREWAYAVYTFNLLGASASYALYGDPFVKVVAPIIIQAFVLVSYRQWKTRWM